MTQVLDMPLNGGQDEGTDRILLPADGTKFRLMQNLRLDRTGRIAIRPFYTAIASDTDPNVGSLVFKDVGTYRDRAVFGANVGSVATLPALLTTAVPELPNPWETAPAGPFPAFSEIRNVWQNASGAAARQFDLAYANNQLCAVQVDDSNVMTITRLTPDGVQLMRTQVSPISSARVVACGNTFVLVTRGTTGTMAARTYDTTASTDTFSSSSTLEATVATGTTHWDLAPIPGTTDYLVTYPRPASTSIRLRRYTIAHALSATADVTPTTAVGDLAVAAASTSLIVWAYSDGNTLKIRTLNGSLTTTVGPTTINTATGIRAPGVAVTAGSVLSFWVLGTTATASYSDRRDFATHTQEATDATAPNVWGASKPLTLANSFSGGACYVAGQVSAGSAFALPFYTACIYDALLPGNVHGVWDYGVSSPLDILSASDTGGRSSIATDGTYYYVASTAARGLELGAGVPGALRVVRVARAMRHQMVEAGGLLHIAGGNVCTWDGATLSTASFPDVPNVISIAQDASGSQTLLATYQYIAMYEFTDAAGNTQRSTPSAPLSVTLTGANNRAIPTCSTPRTAKRVGNGVTPRVILYRANPGDSVFFRVAESSDLGVLDTASTVAINDGVSDVTAETREILYTQSQKPTPNVAAGSAQFIAVGRDRLILGGLQDPNQVKLSQAFFPGEPPEFAHPSAFGYLARLPQPCTGVAASGDTYIAFTEDAIFAIPGSGPQRNGSGEFFAPQTVYADGGCIDWRSIVSCGAGVFFQLDTDKIFVLRPGGQAEWVGEPVQDTLASYPVIVGACLCSATQQVVFACQNTAGNDGALLIYDVATGVWSTDNVLASAVAEHNGRLVYTPTSTGAPFVEALSAGLGTAGSMTASLRTGSMRPFGISGFGDLFKVQLLGTYVGDSTVEGFISLDDGKTWTSLGSIAATAANTALGNNVSGSALSSGDSITLEWMPNGGGNLSRFALRFDITETSDTGALRLHALALEVQAVSGTARLSAGVKN